MYFENFEKRPYLRNQRSDQKIDFIFGISVRVRIRWLIHFFDFQTFLTKSKIAHKSSTVHFGKNPIAYSDSADNFASDGSSSFYIFKLLFLIKKSLISPIVFISEKIWWHFRNQRKILHKLAHLFFWFSHYTQHNRAITPLSNDWGRGSSMAAVVHRRE